MIAPPAADAALLAVSTSAPLWTVYLRSRAGETGTELELSAPRGHARDLLGAIDDLLQRAGLRVSDLGGIAVDVGPGSFTSLRMGLATVRGLAWARDLPVCGVTSLQALTAAARTADANAPVAAVVAARRGWWYAGFSPGHGQEQSLVTDDAGLSEALAQWSLRADGRLVAAGSWPDHDLQRHGLAVRAGSADSAHPRASDVARAARALGLDWVPATAVLPAYLAASEAEIQLGWEAPAQAQPSERRPV